MTLSKLLKSGLSIALMVSIATPGMAGLVQKLKRDGAYWFELKATGFILGAVHEIQYISNVPPFDSYEGVMHVGGEGGPIYIEESPVLGTEQSSRDDRLESEAKPNRSPRLLVTPLEFSINNRNVERAQKIQDKMYLTKYIERKVKSPFLDTAKEWEDAISVPFTNFHPLRWKVNRGSHGWGDSGTFNGRVVWLTYEGSLFKSWEAIIQRGHKAAGRAFVRMSIREESLARYALATMQSGMIVRFHYTKPATEGVVWPTLDTIFRPVMDVSLRILPESKFDIFQIEQKTPEEEEEFKRREPQQYESLRVIDEEAFTDSSVNLMEYLSHPPHSLPETEL